MAGTCVVSAVYAVILFTFTATPAAAQTTTVSCPPDGTAFSMAGSSTALPLSNVWSTRYMELCPSAVVATEGGGSTLGAQRVCAKLDGGTAVDIGILARDLDVSEASTANGWKYTCLQGDTTRVVTQVAVAMDGLAVVTLRGGSADSCIALLGGLTRNQLRWIYSSYTPGQLVGTGWDASSVPYSDGMSETHLWSELNPACPAEEIVLAGPDALSETYSNFLGLILTDFGNGETVDLNRSTGYFSSAVDDDLAQHLISNGNAISYFGFSAYYSKRQELSAVPIFNDKFGTFVAPDFETVQDGTYAPLSRRIYMNLLDATLGNTKDFILFGLSIEGTALAMETGYIPIPDYEKIVMISRAGGISPSILCGPTGGSISIAGSTAAFPIAKLWAGIYDDACDVNIKVEAGGSNSGASYVCGNTFTGISVDIGTMSRDWKTAEATATTIAGAYQCASPSARSAIQIEVARDGLAMVTAAGGDADTCIQALGGLTLDQLRWIYSSYTSGELVATRWNPEAVLNSDGDDSTRLWSELANVPGCPATPIKIAGSSDSDENYEFFLAFVLADSANGETFDFARYVNSAVQQDLVNYIVANLDAISFLEASVYYKNDDALSAAGIQNVAGVYVIPSAASVGDGSYDHFTRLIFMNLWDDTSSLANTSPFLGFGLSESGRILVAQIGYVSLPSSNIEEMLKRLGGTAVNATVLPTATIATTVAPVAVLTPASTTSPGTAAPTGGIVNDPAVSPAPIVVFDPQSCGPGGHFSIAGSSTVYPIAIAWGKRYMEECPGSNITVDQGGSSVGAGRVCDDPSRGSAVDIGDMSREWKTSEAVSVNGFLYKCLIGDQTRSVIQIVVAVDGITVSSVRGGSGDLCLQALGGISTDQLRWMYSSYSIADLTRTGWDPKSLRSSDGDDSTHFWSELADDPACPRSEIKIAGADDQSGTYEYFLETIITDSTNGETFDLDRVGGGYFNSEFDTELVDYLEVNPNAMSYFGFAYYYANKDTLTAASIKNGIGSFVVPSHDTVASGSYAPLSRRIFMNLWDNEKSLNLTAPFITFGFSSEGTSLVDVTGYVPIPQYQKIVMLSRVGGSGGIEVQRDICGPVNGSISIAGSVTVFPIAQVWADVYGDACGVEIFVEADGSANGAGRVCSNPAKGSPVQIGDMSRDWKVSEAITSNGWYYTCVAPGDSSRSVIQIAIAIDGITVATSSGGVADRCIQALGGGLTTDQLRWIFSSYNTRELENSGWDSKKATPNSDENDATHLWSELLKDPRCPGIEIRISGLTPDSGSYDYFANAILVDSIMGETFDLDRPLGYVSNEATNILVDYITTNAEAISFFNFASYRDFSDSLAIASIENNQGEYVLPDVHTIQDGKYNPLSRRIYMNVLDTESNLINARPFFKFGFGPRGSDLVAVSGYSPIPLWERSVMSARLRIDGSAVWDDIRCGPTGGNVSIVGSTSLLSLADVWAGVYKLPCSLNLISESDGFSPPAGLRVCSDPRGRGLVDVGITASRWLDTEASTSNGYVYQCLTPGDVSRSVIQIEIAIEAIAVATKKGGIADICISGMSGLTHDQLRWIYSNYSSAELSATGWDSTSVPYSDDDDDTHLWSELNAACPPLEIKVAGLDEYTGGFHFFRESFFTELNSGESFALGRPGGFFATDVGEYVADYIFEHEDAIAYLGCALYYNNSATLSAVPIRNSEGAFVVPTPVTVGDGSYNPLSRRVTMNILRYEDVLESVRPILTYGLEVDSLVQVIGFFPISATEKQVMLSRLSAPGIVRVVGPQGASSGDSGGLSPGAIVGILGGLACGLCLMGLIYVRRRYREYEEDSVHDYEGSLHGYRGPRSVASKHSNSVSAASQDRYNGAVPPMQEQPQWDNRRGVQTGNMPPVRQQWDNRRNPHSGGMPPMQGQNWNNGMNNGMNNGGMSPMQDTNWNNAMTVYRGA
jgi:phosphate transport system substrate-binding protein